MNATSAKNTTSPLTIVLLVAVLSQNLLSVMILRELRTRPAPTSTSARPPQESLPIGTSAPGFSYLDTAEQKVTLADLDGGRALLVFSSPTCRYCRELYPELRRFAETQQESGLDVLLLQLGSSPQENLDLKQEQGFPFEVLAADREAFVRYRIPGTPFGVLLDESRRIENVATLISYSQLMDFVTPRNGN